MQWIELDASYRIDVLKIKPLTPADAAKLRVGVTPSEER